MAAHYLFGMSDVTKTAPQKKSGTIRDYRKGIPTNDRKAARNGIKRLHIWFPDFVKVIGVM